MLRQIEIPVAFSMVAVAERLPDNEPLQKYMTYWIAFNSIYVTLAQYAGEGPSLRKNDNGTVRTRSVATVQMAMVNAPSEKRQMRVAVNRMGSELRRALVTHPSTEFFVYREPEWRGRKIIIDGNGQRVNGVINVGRTVNARYPVWSPIEIDRYERCVKGDPAPDDVDKLAQQIIDVLYTIRNNTMHGGKRADYENDREVVAKALPLLQMVVSNFLLPPY
jgi:hypothetical protein